MKVGGISLASITMSSAFSVVANKLFEKIEVGTKEDWSAERPH